MANKDGIVSIGFDYKKELDEVCATIEKELNNLGGDINLSDGIKKQMAEIKKMITDMKKDIGSSFDKITETKLDTKTFETFKKDINKRIREVNKEVSILKEQFSTLDGSANVNGIVQQFANLKKHVEDSNASISEFISNSEKLGKSVVISSNLNTDGLKNDVVEIKKLLTDLNKEDLDFGYTNKSAKELSSDLEGLVDKYYRITDLIDEMKSSMSGLDSTTQEYKNQEVQLSKLSLELLKCSAQMDDLFGAKNAEKINVDKIISADELDDIFAHIQDISSKIKLEAKNIVDSIELSNVAVKNVNNNNTTSDLSNKSNIELHISTKQSTINKQLDEMIDTLQQRAANKPIIAPVKLRVDSEYEKTTKDTSTSVLTENQINEARKDVESVVPGLEKAFNNSMRIATNKAVETAKESIKAVREFFESNPITVHLTVPDDEKAKIGKAILSEDGKTTVNISGEVDKARKSVKGLSEDLEKSQLLIKENAQNAKNLSLEKLVNSLSETMSQFSELKGIITSIQNMENTIARASGISSTNELVEQWSIVEKTIINATKLDGDFRKNANIGKIVSEYQKYIDMGGTNTLSGIDKIKDNESTINSILSKMKELKSQDVENDSFQKLSVDLDGVIAKFDELISTVKTATNALYKIIKQGNVSDLDKQWSSISDKFKSIADEFGKINLSKQKTDIKELMDMYQKYTNAGGTNSLMSLTDNVKTLRKLDKEYQKLNQTQTVDNSSTIEKESESFKNVEKSVDSLTTAIGDTKVQAINIEATAMEDAAEREIMAIRSILDNLDLIVSRLKDIKGIKLPKIEVKNVDVVEKAVESFANAGNKSNISSDNFVSNNFLRDTENKIIKWYRTVEDSVTGLFTAGRTGSFFSDNLELSRGYADFNAKTYEVAIKLTDKILELQGKGRANWDTLKYLGFGTDNDSKEIIGLSKQFDNLTTNIRNAQQNLKDFYSISSESKKGIKQGKSIDEIIDYYKQIQEINKMMPGMMPDELHEFDLTQEDDINRLKTIIQYFYSIEDVVKRIKEINMDKNNLYGMSLPEEYHNLNIDANNDPARLTTNRMTDKAANFGYDAVLFKDIHDSAKAETSRIISSILSVINNSIVDNVNVLTNSQIDKQLGNDILERIVFNTDEFITIINQSLQNILSNCFTDTNEDKAEIQKIIDNVLAQFKSHIQEELYTEVNSFDDLIERICYEIRKQIDDNFIPGKTITSQFKSDIRSTYDNLLNGNSENSIKDVFQGDEASKINEIAEATNNLADAENRLNIVEDKKTAQKYWQGRFKDSVADITKTNDELLAMRQYYSELEKLNGKITSVQNKVDNANIDIGKLSKRDVQSDDYVKAVENYRIAIDELQNHITYLNNNGIQSQDDINELNRLQSAVDEISKSIKNMSASEKGTNLAKSSTVFLKIEELRDKYKGMSKDMQNELNKLERKFRETGNSLDTSKAIGELKQFETQLIKTGTATNSLWSAMKNKAFYNFANQLGTMVSFYDVINVIRQAGEAVIDLNTNITELAKVSEASVSQIYDDFNSYADIAKEVGGTISDTISATADWSRNGYNIPDAKELAEVAMIYKNVGDGIDIDQANEYLISTLRGFSLEAKDAMDIIDSINEVANNEPISSAGIGEALQRSAAAFNVANTSLQESIALVTSTNSVLQSPEKVGSMWTTVSARIRGKIVPIYNENYSLCA